jgi:hypothetical protein
VRAHEDGDLLTVLFYVPREFFELLGRLFQPVRHERRVNEIRIELRKRLRLQKLDGARNSTYRATWGVLRSGSILRGNFV